MFGIIYGSENGQSLNRRDVFGGSSVFCYRKTPMKPVQRQLQTIPVRLYQTKEQLMLAAPLPGLQPSDIAVAITEDRVMIRGVERGPGQHGRDVLLDEWTVGPYYREVKLPRPVNGPAATATYGNGVLVLVMPKARRRKLSLPADIKLYTGEPAQESPPASLFSVQEPATEPKRSPNPSSQARQKRKLKE